MSPRLCGRIFNQTIPRASVVLFLLVLTLHLSYRFAAATETFEAWVEEVVDGDTVRLSDGESVRYLGIDTPELRKKIGGRWIYSPERFSEEALSVNRNWVEGKKVRLEIDPEERKDRYGRLLAYVFIGDIFVNEKLLERGLAKRYHIAGPHRKYRRIFQRAEEYAMKRRRGVWSQ